MACIHRGRAGAHVDRHAQRLQHLLARGAALNGGLGVESDAIIAARRDRDRERDQEATGSSGSFKSCSDTPGARAWLTEQEAELLPVPYYHLVFTLPAALAQCFARGRRWRTNRSDECMFGSLEVKVLYPT